MTDLDELKLDAKLEQRESVIRILERDLRECERKRRKLYSMLMEVCKENFCYRCRRDMIDPHCERCNYRKTLKECE